MDFQKQLSRKLSSQLDKKQDQLLKQPAVFARNFIVPNQINYNYVIISGNIVPVYNDRVPARAGVKIWVGYDASDQSNKKRKKFQVLATRSEDPSGGLAAPMGYAPAKRYEYNAEGGGQDPLYVHQRAITFLRVGTSKTNGCVRLNKGKIWTGTAYKNIATQEIDLSAQVPSTTGKAAFVLITIDTSGVVVQTKGSEVDIDALAEADRPAVPVDTAYPGPLCFVRVYEGQVKPQEGRVNTDFDDVRFAGWSQTDDGGVQSIVAGTNITIDDTDPANPIVSASGSGTGNFQRNIASNLTLTNGQCLVVVGYLNMSSYDLQLQGDSELMIL